MNQTGKRLSLLTMAAAIGLSSQAVSAEPTVIELTQTPCQFVEGENGVDHGFSSNSADDCKVINSDSGEERLARAEPMKLKAGSYIFRVTNSNVPYDLGFYLRGSGLVDKVKLPKVSGGGLTTGATKDYVIDLVAGDYVYSCPLNPTPDYKIVVQ